MVRCSCGTDGLENRFCTDCGRQLRYDCTECKKIVAVTEKFCGTCGTKNPHYDAKAYDTHPR